MKISAPFCLLALALSAAATGQAQEWPHFGGPGGDFTVTNRLAGCDWSNRPPAQVWRVALSDRGYACPSLADGAVFVIDHEGSNDVVRAFALESGAERWRFAYPDTAASANGYARAAPSWDEGRLYTLSRLGLLHCLDARNGRPLWQKHCVRDFGGERPEHSFCAPPAVCGSRLILCTGGRDGSVVALDKVTGRLLWRGGPPGAAGHALPLLRRVGGRDCLLCFSSRAFFALDPATGQTLWSTPRPTPFGNNIAQPLVFGDRILLSAGDGMGTTLLEVKDGQVSAVWNTAAYHTLFSTPVAAGDLLFLSSNTRQQGLTCVSLATGEVRWTNPRFDKYTTLLRAADRVVALEAAKGDLVLIEPDAAAYRESARFKPLGKLSWTPPLLAGDRLVVRNEAGLACLRLSGP